MGSKAAEMVFATGANVLASVALVLANKLTVAKQGFDFMIVLTGLHFYSSFLCCFVLLIFGVLQYKQVRSYNSLLRIASASLASIVFMNLNLKHNSVAFYQMSKLLCIPTSLILERLFHLRSIKSELNLAILSSLTMIIVGMCLVAEGELEYDSQTGLMYMGLGVFFTSIAQVFFAPLQKQLGLNSIQLLFHTSPWMAFSSFALTPLCEDTHKLVEYDMNQSVVFAIAVSCIMAFLLNVTNYRVLELTTPLSYQILGHVKTICIVLSGIFFFDQVPSVRVSIGLICGVCGMLSYGYEKQKKLHLFSDLVASTSTKMGSFVGGGHENNDAGNGRSRRASIPGLTVAPKHLTKRDTRATMSPVGTSPTSPSSVSDRGSMSPTNNSVGSDKSFRSWMGDTADSDDSDVRGSTGYDSREKELYAIFKIRSTSISASKTAKPSDSEKLKLYGYYKFVESGKCNTPRPGMFDPVGRAKWDAYVEVSSDGSKSRTEVMKDYIALADVLLMKS